MDTLVFTLAATVVLSSLIGKTFQKIEGWNVKEEGGGFGMGNTCIPVADSF